MYGIFVFFYMDFEIECEIRFIALSETLFLIFKCYCSINIAKLQKLRFRFVIKQYQHFCAHFFILGGKA